MKGSLALVLSCAAIGTAAHASDLECYDAKVRARVIAQVPTVYPRSDDPNVIIMSWPWFVDLDVKRVIGGTIDGKTVMTLAVMHVGYVKKTLTWLLRKNAAGFYNVVRADDPKALKRCPAGVSEARPYITPAAGKTYADLRREGKTAYRALGGEPE